MHLFRTFPPKIGRCRTKVPTSRSSHGIIHLPALLVLKRHNVSCSLKSIRTPSLPCFCNTEVKSIRKKTKSQIFHSVKKYILSFSTLSSSVDSHQINLDQPVSISTHLHLLSDIPLEDVRNFCFIAHIDHGKSSLASRVLELVGNFGTDEQIKASKESVSEQTKSTSLSTRRTMEKTEQDNDIDVTQNVVQQMSPLKTPRDKEKFQLLDTLSVEKERGITVKASAASFLYPHPSAIGPHGLLLYNMVDTPGHVDFGTEVTRTLSSVQGAVLLFDSTQGIQAQSLSVYEKAKKLNVHRILPALTKVDLPTARTLDVTLSVSELFGFDPESVLLTSARSRIGIATILHEVGAKVQSPQPFADDDGITLRAKIIDSWFEASRGVICLVQILSGHLEEGDRVCLLDRHLQQGDQDGYSNRKDAEEASFKSRWYSLDSKENYSVQDVGLLLPHRIRTHKLRRGQMGYVVVGIRDPRQAKPGTIMVQVSQLSKVSKLSLPDIPLSATNILSARSVLFASVHPTEGEGFDELAMAVDKLALNDSGLEIHRTSGTSNTDGGPFLGPGLRIGFQGLLHMEVFQQRLRDEFGIEALVTQPKVPYIIKYLPSKAYKMPDNLSANSDLIVEDLAKWPTAAGLRFKVLEPVVNVRIMSPLEYAGNIMDLIKKKRGTEMETKPIDEVTWLFSARMPWGEIVTDFHDELKNTSAGYASFDSFEAEPTHQEADLVRVDILLNGEIVTPLAFVCHKSAAQQQGRDVCEKLQKVLPRQQFVTVIQAKAEGKVIASERIKAFRKDVLSRSGKVVGGGDVTRKKKLLEKQKEGKKRLKQTGKVSLSQDAFNAVITRSS